MLYLLNAINCDVSAHCRSFSLSKVVTAEYKSGNSKEKVKVEKHEIITLFLWRNKFRIPAKGSKNVVFFYTKKIVLLCSLLFFHSLYI